MSRRLRSGLVLTPNGSTQLNVKLVRRKKLRVEQLFAQAALELGRPVRKGSGVRGAAEVILEGGLHDPRGAPRRLEDLKRHVRARFAGGQLRAPQSNAGTVQRAAKHVFVH